MFQFKNRKLFLFTKLRKILKMIQKSLQNDTLHYTYKE